jgi:uncharacterized SAM-binding protein YcdF (DUF218 family)
VAGLKAHRVQAIVILGGDVLPQAPEYGESQPGAATAARLRYGVWLARQSGLPLAFTGGLGWAAHSSQRDSEAAVAARVAQQDYGMALRWSEAASRDTAGNARLLAPLLQRDGVQRIALVTHAWHMPRAVAAFEASRPGRNARPHGLCAAGAKRPAGMAALRARPAGLPSGAAGMAGAGRRALALNINPRPDTPA